MSEIARQLLVCLIAAHLIGDFILQGQKKANSKSNVFILLKHSCIVAALSYIICGIWEIWEIPVVIFVTHSAIDFIKASIKKKTAYLFLIDQAAHLLVMVILALIITNENATIYVFWVNLLGSDFIKVLIVLSGGIAAVKSGSILIGLAVEPFIREIAEHNGGEGQQEKPLNRGLRSGGSVIGQLERSLIFIFILIGQPEGIGFLIAAKSIFRFGEIKEPKHRREAEYIIIGTLMSFSYGILISYATKFFLDLF